MPMMKVGEKTKKKSLIGDTQRGNFINIIDRVNLFIIGYKSQSIIGSVQDLIIKTNVIK